MLLADSAASTATTAASEVLASKSRATCQQPQQQLRKKKKRTKRNVQAQDGNVKSLPFDKVEVAYRVYCADGDKEDHTGHRYRGVPGAPNEWIVVTSIRLAPLHQQVKNNDERFVCAAHPC